MAELITVWGAVYDPTHTHNSGWWGGGGGKGKDPKILLDKNSVLEKDCELISAYRGLLVTYFPVNPTKKGWMTPPPPQQVGGGGERVVVG